MGSEGVERDGALPRGVAAAVASTALIVPFVLSRSTTPSPDHPRVFFWYRLLRKPAIQPPDIAIPITWLGIESALAYSGYRIARSAASPSRSRALVLFAVNVFGIGAWSRLFFGGRDLPSSTVAAAALAATATVYVHEAREVDRPAAAAGVPLVAWVAFATVLTAAIWRKNA